MRRTLLRALAGLGVLVLLALTVFFVWLATPAGEPLSEAREALESSERVQVADGVWLAFAPQGAPPEVGYVFFPGARVPPAAYAPMARRLAEAGIYTAIVRPPLNVSSFDVDLPTPVMAAHPTIETWVLGGHSLGGSTALRYAQDHPDAVAGVVLLASRPMGRDLSDEDLPVVSIYGTRDGVLTEEEVHASGARLPPGTAWVPIEGGNHAQFGSYGDQWRDQAAAISRAAQRDQVVAATRDFIARLARTEDGLPRPTPTRPGRGGDP